MASTKILGHIASPRSLEPRRKKLSASINIAERAISEPDIVHGLGSMELDEMFSCPSCKRDDVPLEEIAKHCAGKCTEANSSPSSLLLPPSSPLSEIGNGDPHPPPSLAAQFSAADAPYFNCDICGDRLIHLMLIIEHGVGLCRPAPNPVGTSSNRLITASRPSISRPAHAETSASGAMRIAALQHPSFLRKRVHSPDTGRRVRQRTWPLSDNLRIPSSQPMEIIELDSSSEEDENEEAAPNGTTQNAGADIPEGPPPPYSET